MLSKLRSVHHELFRKRESKAAEKSKDKNKIIERKETDKLKKNKRKFDKSTMAEDENVKFNVIDFREHRKNFYSTLSFFNSKDCCCPY